MPFFIFTIRKIQYFLEFWSEITDNYGGFLAEEAEMKN